MKYRSKLFFSFFFLSAASSLSALLITYKEAKNLIFDELRHKALSIAATTASFVNGNLVQELKGNEEPTEAYQTLFNELIRARNVNRRIRTYVEFVYIIIPSKTREGEYIYALDAYENPHDRSHYGDPFVAEHADYKALSENHPDVLRNFERDPYGYWLTAYAPIYNSEGKKVGTLGMDFSHAHLSQLDELLFTWGILSLAFSILLAILLGFILSKLVTKSLRIIHNSIIKIGEGDLETKCILHSEDEFQKLAEALNHMTEGLKEREKLKLGFARYVSRHVLDRIIKTDIGTALEGERKKITILFADIRYFTTLSESLTPEQVVQILNQYFSKMIEIIFKHKGTLDKFIGDGLMAEFGTPLQDEQQELNAVTAALHMQKEMEKLNEEWEKTNIPALSIGIGIHTGYAIVGNVGSEQRMEYTAIGDAVNTASRIEQSTKLLKKSIILSKETYEKVKDLFFFEELGLIQLPGKKEKMELYSILVDESYKKIK